MALSDPVLIASEFSTTAVTGPATRSVATTVATDASDVIVAVSMIHGTNPTDTAVLSGGSLSWSKLRTATYSGSGAHRMTMWVAQGAMASSTSLSYGPGGTFASTGTDLLVFKVPGASLTPVQHNSNAAATNPLTVTLGSSPGASNLVMLFGNIASTTAYSSGTGTEAADGTHSSPTCRTGMYWDRTSAANPMTMTNGVSAAWVAISVELTEAATGTTVTPSTLATTTALFAPTVTASDHQSVTPATASLTSETFAPSVTASDQQTVTPTTASLASETFAPSVSATAHATATPDNASLSLSTFAPTVTAGEGLTLTPDTAALTATSFAPTVTVSDHQTVVPDPASLALATFIPVVTTADPNVTVTPGTAALTISGFAPSVTTGSQQEFTGNPWRNAAKVVGTHTPYSITVTVSPNPARLSLSTFVPQVVVNDDELVLQLL